VSTNPESLAQARKRWKHRHGDVSRFEATVAFLNRATSLNDITHPAEGLPFGALHHHFPADFYNVIEEADIMLTFRVVATGADRLEIEIGNRDRFKQLVRAYLTRRASAVRHDRPNAETAVTNSANVVALAAAAAGTVTVVRNIIGAVKDSLDIGRYFRERAHRKNEGDQT
jgi:hypothetical protein